MLYYCLIICCTIPIELLLILKNSLLGMSVKDSYIYQHDVRIYIYISYMYLTCIYIYIYIYIYTYYEHKVSIQTKCLFLYLSIQFYRYNIILLSECVLYYTYCIYNNDKLLGMSVKDFYSCQHDHIIIHTCYTLITTIVTHVCVYIYIYILLLLLLLLLRLLLLLLLLPLMIMTLLVLLPLLQLLLLLLLTIMITICSACPPPTIYTFTSNVFRPELVVGELVAKSPHELQGVHKQDTQYTKLTKNINQTNKQHTTP